MSNLIEFIPRLSFKEDWENIQKPKPAKTFIPDWYKKTPLLNKVVDNETINSVPSLKGCMPFLDAMTSGYIISTWFEIKVVRDFGSVYLVWNIDYNPIKSRQDIDLPTPPGYEKNMFALDLPFGFKVPSGYSLLATQPLNRPDTPFIVTSGIIDDNVLYAGTVPFWIKNDFEGLIPIGTPILQIIPFKRENWKSCINEQKSKEAESGRRKTFTYISGFYKKNIHKKKSFE
jgi:hypothetical protein